MLSKENLAELRHNLAHLGFQAVRDFYFKAYEDCRLIYNQLPIHARSKLSFKCGNSCGSGADLR